MGYTLKIGEAFIEAPSPEDVLKYDERDLRIYVKGKTHKDAPTFPGDWLTGKGNDRSPSYSQWGNLCDETGLRDLFYNKEHGLIKEHPGAVLITAADLDVVRQALNKRKATNGGMPPGWCECATCDAFRPHKEGTPVVEHKDYDGGLARLIWLEWWMTWALKNCKIPTFYNS